MGNTALLIPPSLLEAALCQVLDGEPRVQARDPMELSLTQK